MAFHLGRIPPPPEPMEALGKPLAIRSRGKGAGASAGGSCRPSFFLGCFVVDLNSVPSGPFPFSPLQAK